MVKIVDSNYLFVTSVDLNPVSHIGFFHCDILQYNEDRLAESDPNRTGNFNFMFDFNFNFVIY